MKTTLFVLILLLISPLHAQENCQRQTWMHQNGKPFKVVEWDSVSHSFCGMFQEFDSTGILMEEGCYQIVTDPMPCKDCYECSSAFNDIPAKWKKYDFLDDSYVREFKTGTWKYYHTNGKLKAAGEYAPIFHAFNGTSLSLIEQENEGHAINVYIHPDQLKTGTWNYYDEHGNNFLTEDYVNGSLVYKIERN